jgi:prefoldin subunit 5
MLSYALIVALTVASLVVVALVVRLYQMRQRHDTLRAIMDSADALERELYACRERMQTVQRWVSTLPSSITAEALASLNLDPLVQKALRDLLQQRLWLRDNADHAPMERLREARAVMERARTTLSENMAKLEAASEELAKASSETHPVSALIASAYGIGGNERTGQPIS